MEKMKKDVEVTAIVPVYNEEDSVEATLQRLKKTLKESGVSHEIIAINDASKDGSGKILEKVSGVKVIHHKKNKGYGASLKSGILEAAGDWILITDADGTYPIEDAPKLLRERKDNEMVVGARTGKHVKIPLTRRPAKWILKMFVRALTGIKVPDLNSGLRVFKKELAIEYWNLLPNGFSFTTTITVMSLVDNHDVKYIPINYFSRKGKSSINPIRDFIGFSILILKLITYSKPLNFYLPSALVVLLLGIAKGTRDYLRTNGIDDLSVILCLVAVQIFFFGLLADMMSKRLKTNVWDKRV